MSTDLPCLNLSMQCSALCQSSPCTCTRRFQGKRAHHSLFFLLLLTRVLGPIFQVVDFVMNKALIWQLIAHFHGHIWCPCTWEMPAGSCASTIEQLSATILPKRRCSGSMLPLKGRDHATAASSNTYCSICIFCYCEKVATSLDYLLRGWGELSNVARARKARTWSKRQLAVTQTCKHIIQG